MLGGIARRCALGHPGAVVQCSNSAGQSLLRRLAGDVGARLGLARTFGGATAARSSSDGLNSFLDGTRFARIIIISAKYASYTKNGVAKWKEPRSSNITYFCENHGNES